jgi:hypothetical protein
MNEQEVEAAREAWIQQSAEISAEMSKLDIPFDPCATLSEILPLFNDAFRYFRQKYPPLPYSGLIELQRHFRKLHPKARFEENDRNIG